MTQTEIMDVLYDCHVLLEGHFQLTSGKHSNRYMQCARLFEHPAESKELCDELSEQLRADGLADVDLVVGPAIGGIIMAYQVAECLGVRNLFAERVEGEMTLRRGFSVAPGERVLICEDVVTTGGSVKEVIALLKKAGAEVIGVASIVDRSGSTVDFGVPFRALVNVAFDTYEPESCPLCAVGGKAEKPGSRAIR